MAGFRGGYGGGFGGGQMQQLMRQAQKMQQEMQRADEELEQAELIGESGSGMVKVTVNGKKTVLGVSISPEAVDPDDVEMLEDLIMAALGNAYEQADKLYQEKMGPYAKNGMGGLI